MDIGLKVDTTHVGWCVTDGMDIVKKKKQLIGVSLFNEATTNEDRRGFRSGRRMNERKHERITFLTEVMEEELNKKDAEFISRLKESGLMEEDRTVAGNIFRDKREEQEYYKKYPTIYHLRSHMLHEGDDDIRLLYMSLLHMFKHRGNFLLKDVNAKNAVSFEKTYKELRVAVNDLLTLPKDSEMIGELEKIIRSKENNRVKLEQIMELLGFTKKDKVYTTLFQLVLGMKGDLKNLFPAQLEWCEEDTKVCFSGCDDFETLKAPYELYIEIEQMQMLDSIKALFDWSRLDFILKGEKCIADAMAKSYDKHCKDLAKLKEIYKYYSKVTGDNSLYKDMFQTNSFEDGKEINNYSSYIGKSRDLKKKRQVTCSREEFFTYTEKQLKQMLEVMGESKEHEKIREKISECLIDMDILAFLPKQKSKDNTFIPNVILAEEMNEILKKAAIKHPFLLKTEKNSGLAIKDAILAMFTFQIPYWMGPVNGDIKYAWAVRKEEGRVYPWNVEDKIDIVKTRRQFMDRIIGDCSLLFYEKVLPDNSFFVRKLQCLDELNKVRIDGEKLPVQAKQLIFDELFCKFEKVTQKGVVSLLEAAGFLEPAAEYEFTGFVKKKLTQNMAPYVKAMATYPQLDVETYEKIAECITVCKQDKSLLKMALRSEITLDEKIVDSLINVIRDSGWSEYSQKSITVVLGSGEADKTERSIVDQLYETQSSMAELLGSSYNYVERFNEINKKTSKSIKDMLNDISNPKIRRSFQQMVNVAKDLRNYLKTEPEYIYLNVYVPADGTRVRTENRKAELTRLLKNAGEKELLKQLKTEKTLSMRKYLYYLQKGRCLYSGEVIPYEEVEKANSRFNIEHILPQSKVYDRTANNNLCLVKKSLNEDKGNVYPIDEEIQKEMMPVWNALCEEGFLTVKKYEALTSVNGIPVERKLESIDRLLVEHRKTAFKAAVLLNRIFPNAKVVFVSDTVLRDFKKKFEYEYDERVNELGAAKDAYFTTVCGNVWYGIFGLSPKKYIMENKDYSLNVFNYDSENWKASGEESQKKVASTIRDAYIMQSVMAFSKESGSLYKMSLLSSDYMAKCKTSVSGRKGNFADARKYGGYNTLTVSHFCIVKSGDMIRLESVPLIMLDKLKTQEDYIEYFESKGMKDVEIIKKRVLKKAVIFINGFKYYLSTVNDTSMVLDSGVPFILSEQDEKYFYMVQRFNQQAKNGNVHKSMYEILNEQKNSLFFEHFLEKYQNVYGNRVNLGLDKLVEAKKNVFDSLSLEKQCQALENLFGLVYRKRPLADLKIIGLSANTGKIAVSRNLSNFESFIIVEESATGLYRKKTVIK